MGFGAVCKLPGRHCPPARSKRSILAKLAAKVITFCRPGDIVADWYADYPDHYAGDATAASAEKGAKLRDLQVGALVDFVRAVKEDTAVHPVLKEFYDRCDELGK